MRKECGSYRGLVEAPGIEPGSKSARAAESLRNPPRRRWLRIGSSLLLALTLPAYDPANADPPWWRPGTPPECRGWTTPQPGCEKWIDHGQYQGRPGATTAADLIAAKDRLDDAIESTSHAWRCTKIDGEMACADERVLDRHARELRDLREKLDRWENGYFGDSGCSPELGGIHCDESSWALKRCQPGKLGEPAEGTCKPGGDMPVGPREARP
jgi:hypothetical protein